MGKKIKNCCNYPKTLTMWFYRRVICRKMQTEWQTVLNEDLRSLQGMVAHVQGISILIAYLEVWGLYFQQGLRQFNDPKFSDRYAWANSADPDQTAPRGAV